MKTVRILAAATTILTWALAAGCTEDEPTPGIDPSMPAPEEFSYDPDNSSENAFALSWNPARAVAAGATGFTVQIPGDKDNGDLYDTSVSKTLILGESKVTSGVIFSGLKASQRFYARIRALYRNSVFSEWVYLTIDGEPAPFEMGYGFIDPGVPAVEAIRYDATKADATTLAFTYDDSKAEARGALHIRFQAVNRTTDDVDKEAAKVPGVKEITIGGLKTGELYRVRARAEYAGGDGLTTCSEWAYAATDTTRIFEVGTGPVIPKETVPTARLHHATSSTLLFQWSESGFSSKEKDAARPYSVQLYTDAACENLVVSWEIAANASIYGGFQPAFLFSGLAADTRYWFRVTDLQSGLTSEPVEARTPPFRIVTISGTPAAAGDILLAEDFSEFIWGGDYIYKGPGYSSTARSSATSLVPASGTNPIEGTDLYLVSPTTEMGLFNTLAKAVPSTRLATWGTVNEGPANSYMLVRPGHLKLGAASYTALIATPELSSLGGTATVEVSFKACPYYERDAAADPLDAQVMLVGSSTLGSQNILTVNASTAIEFTLENKKEWTAYQFTVDNVTPSSRIAVGPLRKTGTPGGSQQRMYLDELVVKVVSYGSVAVPLDAPVITATALDQSITVRWNAVAHAASYQVEYKESAASAWTVLGTGGTECKIEGLTPLTSYDVRAKAVAGEASSDYSNVVTLSTIAPAREIQTRLVFANESQIGFQWSAHQFEDRLADIDGSYTLEVFTDEALTRSVTRFGIAGGMVADVASASNGKLYNYATSAWPVPYQTSFTLSGLQPATDYYIRITDTAQGIEGILRAATTASRVQEIPSTAAAAGETILYEDFSQFLYGYETVYGTAGYNSDAKGTATEIYRLEGDNPFADEEKKLFGCTPGTHVGLFNTLSKAVPGTRMAAWAQHVESNRTGVVCVQAGSLKIGASKYTGTIVTPPLTCLSGNATLELSFDISPYCEAAYDPFTARVEVLTDVTEDSSHFITECTVAQERKFNLHEERRWERVTMTLEQVAPGSRIGIGGSRDDGTGPGGSQHRLYLDNIQVKVLSY